MIRLTQLSLRRGTRLLLKDVNLIIHAGQRVGITGANGTGKSSLFALIKGELSSDTGECHVPAHLVIASVAQETPAVDKPALDYVVDGDAELRQVETELRAAEVANNGEKLAKLPSRLEEVGGYTAAARGSTLMHGLGFKPGQEYQPVTTFSGGWRMRLNIARALMCRSDLLLLDEPTNHLDLEAVIWLENWLRSYEGTLLLISHDREFLDHITTHIAHLDQEQIKLYAGNYSAFEQRRAELMAQQQALYEKQQRVAAHLQKYIDRFRAQATKARQAQSRIKALERMELIAPAHVDSPFHFEFAAPDKLPNPLIQLDAVSAGYHQQPILKNITLSLIAGKRLGIVGPNGAGKSTFIKLLAGTLAPLDGKIILSKDLKVGYFAQHQLEQLDPKASPLLHLQRLDPKAKEQELRNFIGGFGFNGDMATASVAPFSGGEKARLVLALVVYQRPNLLLLDEPTNHLDLEMRHAFAVALQSFQGALLVVSHDRHLLRTVTDDLWLVANGKVQVFDGDLDDYRHWLNKQQKLAEQSSLENQTQGINKKQQRQINAEERKKLQPLQTKAKKIEQQIGELTQQKATIETQLNNSQTYEATQRDKLKALLIDKAQLDKQLETLELQWLDIMEEIEKMQRGTE